MVEGGGVMSATSAVKEWAREAREHKLSSLARTTSIALGGWLVASAFIWRDPHQFASTLISGAIIALCSLVAWVRVPWLRVWNSAVAVWVFFSSILLPYQYPALAVNQMLVGLAVLVCSFLPLIAVSADEGTPLLPVEQT
jgi:hypothetical protein